MTYSRLKDTSYLPREPIITGHKVSDREHMHTMMSRNPEMMKSKLQQLIKLKKDLKASDEDDLINYIDSGRLNDINKQNMHKQRQLHRNRKAQIKNVIENVILEYDTGDDEEENIKANATRKKRVVFMPSDPDNPRAKRRKINNNIDNWSVWPTSEKADVDSN